MNRNTYIKIFFYFSFITIIKSHFVLAEEMNDCSNASNGMTYNEVLSLCGKPLEKIEYETKHEDLWIYKYYSLKFKEGKLLLNKKFKGDTPHQKIKKESPKKENLDLNEWGAIEPINNNISFEEIINDAVSNEKPEKVMPKFPPPFKRR